VFDHLGGDHARFGHVQHHPAEHRVGERIPLMTPVALHQAGRCDGLIAV
jgi:hypothetical protein